jgi:hypothetical protein
LDGGAAPLTAGWNGQGLLHGWSHVETREHTHSRRSRGTTQCPVFVQLGRACWVAEHPYASMQQNSLEWSVCRSKQAVLVIGPAIPWVFTVKCWRSPVASRHTHIMCLNCACSQHCVSCAACLIHWGIGLLPLCRWLCARPPYSIHTGSRLGLSYTHTAASRRVLGSLVCHTPHLHCLTFLGPYPAVPVWLRCRFTALLVLNNRRERSQYSPHTSTLHPICAVVCGLCMHAYPDSCMPCMASSVCESVLRHRVCASTLGCCQFVRYCQGVLVFFQLVRDL